MYSQTYIQIKSSVLIKSSSVVDVVIVTIITTASNGFTPKLVPIGELCLFCMSMLNPDISQFFFRQLT